MTVSDDGLAVMVKAAPCDTVKLRVTEGAAAYCELPACEACIEQVPAASVVAVVPDTLQIVGVVEAKLTVSPELAFALKATFSPITCAEIALNVIVWLASTVKLWVTGAAAENCELPAWEAWIEHVPPFARATDVPETVQTEVVRDEKLTANPELADALSVNDMPCGSLGIEGKVMVWLKNSPVPFSAIDCVAGFPFKALSVSRAAPVSGPPAVGEKLMLMLQLAPAASTVVAEQSAGEPEPGTCAKFVLTLRPVAVRFALPMFCKVNDCGLSLLVLPIAVVTKVRAGAWARCHSITAVLLSVKMLPRASTVTFAAPWPKNTWLPPAAISIS